MPILAPTTHSITPDRSAGRLYAPRAFNRRSRQRFTAERTAELLRHLGRAPSYPERIIIARVCAIEFELRRYDSKLDAGEDLSGHALRARLAAETRLRLDLGALGLRPAAPQPPSLALYLAERQDALGDAA